MLPTVIKNCPSADGDFEPLSEFEAQTPETFFGAKPVLYHHEEHAKAWAPREQHERLPFFSTPPGHPTPPECQALGTDGEEHMREEVRVEVFVASK